MLKCILFALEAHRTSARHYACGSGLLPLTAGDMQGVPERVVAPEPRLARIGLGIMRVIAHHRLYQRFTGITPPLGSLRNWHRGLSRRPIHWLSRVARTRDLRNIPDGRLPAITH